MVSPLSPLDFATCFSQRCSNLWGSPSMTRSKTQFNGLGVMPYPLKTLVVTTTRSVSTSSSSWTKHHSPSSSRSTRTRLISSPATSRVPWDARVLAWTWHWSSKNKARHYTSTCDTFSISALR
jgi:hypothetical protein